MQDPQVVEHVPIQNRSYWFFEGCHGCQTDIQNLTSKRDYQQPWRPSKKKQQKINSGSEHFQPLEDFAFISFFKSKDESQNWGSSAHV